ncbi:hypothetical protein HOA59_01655 [archaeon]|jgi:hypothetical protein|nr:hypothetical protein [archaeon]MBT6824121.1 hypothetical protein [archaeon]MBT7107034.1 hypothetical protein [archaeon]MBT7297646.1 hypothetical protein [archaeon]
MVNFHQIYYQLQSSGMFEYLLPFLLIFIIIFSVLEKTFILGVKKTEMQPNPTPPPAHIEVKYPKTDMNMVFSLVLSLIVIANTEIVGIINNYVSKMGLVMVLALVCMLAVGLLSGSHQNLPLTAAAIIAILAAMWSLVPYQYGSMFGFSNWFYIGTDTYVAFTGLALVVGLIYYVRKSSTSGF